MVLLKKYQDYLYHPALNSKLFSAINLVFFILILYLVLLFEIGYQVDTYYDDSDLTYIALACFNFVYLLIVYVWSSHKQIKFIMYALTAISVLSLPIYIFVVSPHYKQMMGSYLIGESNSTFGMLHFLSALAVLIVCFYLWRNIKYAFKANQMLQSFTNWFSIIMGLIILSYELDFVVLHFNRPEYNDMHNLLRQNHLIGWPVLWGIIAFTLMFIGISKNERILRIIGISIFFFALIKLFAVDVWDMPAGGRIIAFSSLAVLLLFISFLYQKLKRIILEKEPEIENQQEINNA